VRSLPRAATPAEAAAFWPAVRADRLFVSAERFEAYCADAPWHARVTGRGEAAVLGLWREHLDVLAMRGVWCSSRHVGLFVRDARSVAGDLGLTRVLSPLLPVELLGPYLRQGLAVCQRIVAIQGHPRSVRQASPPAGVTIRDARDEDFSAVERLDAECFDTFWRYGAAELREIVDVERLAVAVDGDGKVIGYTLATASRGVATLGRLGVAPEWRRQGVAQTLVADVAAWADAAGADALSLCTQEENGPARLLYRSAGLGEISDVYGFAMGGVS
jgi:ribosomal-protein-alanine N-acetyltransferase